MDMERWTLKAVVFGDANEVLKFGITRKNCRYAKTDLNNHSSTLGSVAACFKLYMLSIHMLDEINGKL